MVDECKKATGLEVDGKNVLEIRNVGGPSKDTSLQYSNSDNWFYKYNSLKIKTSDENYKSDYNRLEELDLLFSDNSRNYWFASRDIDNYSDYVYFNIRDSFSSYMNKSTNICYVNSYGGKLGNSKTYGVRPIIVLNSKEINFDK